MDDNHIDFDLSEFSNELKLMIAMMKMDIKDKAFFRINQDLLADMDWEHFVRLVRHHRVYPTIYNKLKGIPGSNIPSQVNNSLKKLYELNIFQMLHLGGEMEQVCTLFSNNAIKAILLKGPVLASDLYGDISFRTSSDLDILVPIDDLQRVERILLRCGYVKDDYIESVLSDWKWRHHHVTYFHYQKNIKLEIHWRLNPGPAKEPGFDQLWARKRVSSVTRTPIYLLGTEDLFLFLISHGARHGWSRLRWLEDITQIVKKDMNWGVVGELFNKYGYLHVGGQALHLAAKLLNVSISKEMSAIITKRSERLAGEALFYIKRMVNLHSEPLPEDVAKFHKHHLYALMSAQQKFLFILSFLYPYPKDVTTLPLPKMLHFLYFPLRPFLLVWRKTKRGQVSP